MRYLLFTIISVFVILSACKKEIPTKGTDAELYNMVFLTSSINWYKMDDTFLAKSAGSGHNFPFLRTWYNAEAATQLDAAGKVQVGTTFNDGSLIVKELYNNNQELERYAILYKQTNHPDADDRGWVWGYVNGNGSVATPASDKGAICTGCHLQPDNIDYMLMNKYFP